MNLTVQRMQWRKVLTVDIPWRLCYPGSGIDVNVTAFIIIRRMLRCLKVYRKDGYR